LKSPWETHPAPGTGADHPGTGPRSRHEQRRHSRRRARLRRHRSVAPHSSLLIHSSFLRNDEGDVMTDKFVAAIDQGTTSSRCIVFNQDGAIVA
ncbi:hypothetical protein FGX00_03255, partial [Xylella fastidiosa subsp. multiplex]|nr:hypothetical protein [Xylella fastidiosa subsp. multiplex]